MTSCVCAVCALCGLCGLGRPTADASWWIERLRPGGLDVSTACGRYICTGLRRPPAAVTRGCSGGYRAKHPRSEALVFRGGWEVEQDVTPPGRDSVRRPA
eukprot:TRINITY_DN11347_c0_g1_i1.p2 TRINITY_DN11347_c0_g1~~TRINITY_DN11347_c0_g1_i1.p2  ORF type:complete len:100 (+),score=1.31 TRINITY_DN11347_c0_g1_i1:269-568(+)